MRNGLESDPGRCDIVHSVPNAHIFNHSSFIHQRLYSPLLGPDRLFFSVWLYKWLVALTEDAAALSVCRRMASKNSSITKEDSSRQFVQDSLLSLSEDGALANTVKSIEPF